MEILVFVVIIIGWSPDMDSFFFFTQKLHPV